jgi:hypothetical protein
MHPVKFFLTLRVVHLEIILLRRDFHLTPVDSGLGVQDQSSSIGSDVVGFLNDEMLGSVHEEEFHCFQR